MAGIEKATEGKVYYDGVDVTDLPVQKNINGISRIY